MTARTGSEYYENPSLYGLRRSARAHHPPDRFQIEESRTKYTEYSSDSDSDAAPKKSRKKSKPRARKAKEEHEEFYDQNGYNSKSAASDEDDDEDDDEVYASSKRARLQELANSKKRRKLQTNSEEESNGTYTPPMRFSSRSSKVVNYSIDHQDDDADLMETDDELIANGYGDHVEPEEPAGIFSDLFC